MGWSNGPPTWAELERVLSGRPGPTNPDAMYPGDGGDSPAWSRKRGDYRPEPAEPPSVVSSDLQAVASDSKESGKV